MTRYTGTMAGVVFALLAGCSPDPILDEGFSQTWEALTATQEWRLTVRSTGGEASWIIINGEGLVPVSAEFDLEWFAVGGSNYEVDLTCTDASYCPGGRCTDAERIDGCLAVAREFDRPSLDGTFDCSLTPSDELSCVSRLGDGSVYEFHRR